MELFFQQVINGIMQGSTYAVVCLGLTLVYGILHIPNIAHGHIYMLGAYMTFTFAVMMGMNFWLATLIAMIILAVFGIFTEKLVFRPLKGKGTAVNPFIAAIGLMYVLENVARIIWGSGAQNIDRLYGDVIRLVGVFTTVDRILVIITAVIVIILLQLFIKKTTLGTAIDAAAQDQEGAALVGINVNRMSTLTFAIAAALAALAASLVAPIFNITSTMGAMLIMKCMVIVVLGGLGSIKGAIIAAYIIGLVEALAGGYISSAYKDVFAFGVLILILTVKPTGLFGREA